MRPRRRACPDGNAVRVGRFRRYAQRKARRTACNRSASDLLARCPRARRAQVRDRDCVPDDVAEIPAERRQVRPVQHRRVRDARAVQRAVAQRATEFHRLRHAGEQRKLRLELKLIADVGFLGFPNAGKSSLLARISTARPKVASYPFTTRSPVLGVVSIGEGASFVACDIPGLIEGAHMNKGLGHEFLRHITRCNLLLFVVDMAGTDGRDPVRDLEVLRSEIREYDEELAKFPWMVVANKMDSDTAEENLKIFRQRFAKVEIVPISAELEIGLDVLRTALFERVAKAATAIAP